MVVQTITLRPSTRKGKKWMVELPGGKKVHFGAVGYEDYTIHKDSERYERYKIRHRKRENWNKSGIGTAGFWSRWLLWNKPSLRASIKATEQKFNIKIIKKRT